MATQFQSGPSSLSPEPVSEARYVARQPILDARGRVHGYELLFRDGPEALLPHMGPLDKPTQNDRDMASHVVLDDTVLFGLERYTNGLPAFVHCTAESLIKGLVHVLPPSMTVLLIPTGTEPAPDLVHACLGLKASGFRLALNDYVPCRKLQPLAERADYLCLDMSRVDVKRRPQALLPGHPSIASMVRKVDSQPDYDRARAAGFTLFQGSYFCQPQLIKNRKVPSNRFFHFELMRHLNREYIDLRKVAELVLRDAALTYRLLRLVNSPLYAMRQEIRSIESALLILGEDAFKRIATLAILSEFNADQSPEILQMALVRARFCTLAADTCTLNPAEQYLLGILSLLPAMLGLPMEALTPTLPLRPRICEALEGAEIPERGLLSWLECHERGDWAACDAIVLANELSLGKLVHCYAEAVDWAKATLHATI
jgi:c-di-GMP-related signal transduction protein